MKEIGGYLELERYHGPMLHEDGIKLDCGRNCLAYLIEAKNIRKIAMPYWMCESVLAVCRQHDVQLRFYHVDTDMRPADVRLGGDEWLYLMNYYGQLRSDEIQRYADKYHRVILDNAQAYFAEPMDGIDTIYTCRKFFGVPDGAILYTNVVLKDELQRLESFDSMRHLLGRFERSADEFYKDSIANNKRFWGRPIQRMSSISENLLHSIDYSRIRERRTQNFAGLSDRLGKMNKLNLRPTTGAFAYPLLLEDGASLRKELIQNKIYVPVLWPNVLEQVRQEWPEYALTKDLLPLPCDQRYGVEEMDYMSDLVLRYAL